MSVLVSIVYGCIRTTALWEITTQTRNGRLIFGTGPSQRRIVTYTPRRHGPAASAGSVQLMSSPWSNIVETAMTKIVIYEVINRQNYELVTAAGDDRPIYIGSREWQEQQKYNYKPR